MALKLEPIAFRLVDLQGDITCSRRLVVAAVVYGGLSSGEGILVKQEFLLTVSLKVHYFVNVTSSDGAT